MPRASFALRIAIIINIWKSREMGLVLSMSSLRRGFKGPCGISNSFIQRIAQCRPIGKGYLLDDEPQDLSARKEIFFSKRTQEPHT
jgi:hypothetical protein